MIDTSIYSQLRPVQAPDPLESYGRLLQIKQALNQQSMFPIQQQEAQEQLKARQIANQEAGLKQKDDQIGTATFLQAGGDQKKHVQLMTEAGARPQAIQGWQQHYVAYGEQLSKKEQTDLENDAKTTAAIGSNAQGLLALPDEQARATQWAMTRAQMIQQGHAKPDQIPEQYPGQDWVQMHANSAILASTQIENALKQKAEGRAAQLFPSQLTAAQTASMVGQKQADAAMLAAAAGHSKATLEKARASLPAERAQAFEGLTDPTEIARAGMTADQQVTTAQTATRNAATAKNEEEMRSLAAGHLGVAQAELGLKQKTYEQTYGTGANPALVGVEPHLRVPAAAGAQKIADDYNKAMDSAANMQTFLDAAKSGNKMAGSNLPIMGAESLQALNGIKRINRTEIDAYQGAGSLLDKIQGKIGKLTSGQPIPADVMKDIEDLQGKLAGNATASANAKMDAHNGIYRSNFKLAPRGQSGATGTPEVTSQADYDKLPKGAKYTNNGVPHVKQ